MKKIYTILVLFSLILTIGSCEKYLDRKNLDSFDDGNFWTSENNMRVHVQGLYTSYFTGYANAWAWGRYFTSGGAADEYYNSGTWTTTTATSGNGWSFTLVRRANLIISRTELMPVSDEAKNHWRGIGRFFRALEYTDLCFAFGDIPYYDREIFPAELDEIYKDRTPIATVVQKIIEDYDYAVANVRQSDGPNQVNKDVVLAFMSRDLLYLGSIMKYHKNDNASADNLFAKAKWAAEQLMSSGRYSVQNDLRGLFTQNSLTTGGEIIFFRAYETGKVTHSLITYQTVEGQQGLTQRALDAFLAADGLPIKQSPVYDYTSDNNIRLFPGMYAGRDPRLAATVAEDLRIPGIATGYALTGICVWKFVPYTLPTDGSQLSDRNITDAPVIRYGEVLLNYAEAAAELGQFDQAAADKSINLLRNRDIKKNNTGNILAKLPPMTISGTNVLANGVQINDPDRDPSVTPLMWEIRRERWVELMQEGFRREDLNRWKMYKYMDNSETGGIPSDGSRGAIFPYTTYTAAQQKEIRDKVGKPNLYCVVPGDSTMLALNPLHGIASRRLWTDGDVMFERQYFNSVPLDQIRLYKEKGYVLTQNPGWDQQ